jgi:hypothetical protein
MGHGGGKTRGPHTLFLRGKIGWSEMPCHERCKRRSRNRRLRRPGSLVAPAQISGCRLASVGNSMGWGITAAHLNAALSGRPIVPAPPPGDLAPPSRSALCWQSRRGRGSQINRVSVPSLTRSVPRGVPQHARVHVEPKLGGPGCSLENPSDHVRRQRTTPLRDEHERRRAASLQLPQCRYFVPIQGMHAVVRAFEPADVEGLRSRPWRQIEVRPLGVFGLRRPKAVPIQPFDLRSEWIRLRPSHAQTGRGLPRSGLEGFGIGSAPISRGHWPFD